MGYKAFTKIIGGIAQYPEACVNVSARYTDGILHC